MKIINDPSFGDHFIQVDDYNFSVYKTKVSKEKNREYTSLVGHCSTLTRALEMMATDMIRHEHRENLNGYIKELNEIYSKFKQLKLNL